MKQIFFSLIVITFLFSCDEIAPTINPRMDVDTEICESGEVDVVNQTRHALVEEFTGVKCVNCPAGTVILQGILDANGEEVSAISIHSGGFSEPFVESDYDFRNDVADNLFNLIGPPLAYPASVINRVKHNGSTFLPVLSKDTWPGIVASQLEKPLVVKLGTLHRYNPDDRLLEICTKIFPQETIEEEDLRITIIITESDIVDIQETASGVVDDYVHRHVMRGAVTPFDGSLITEALTAGATIETAFNFTVPTEWVAENCEITAFVSKGGADKDVLQVVTVHLVE